MTPDDEAVPLVPDEPFARQKSRRAPVQPLKPKRCPGCGYDVRGLSVGGRCPECGAFTGNPLRQRGPNLLMHAGKPTASALVWRLVPIAIFSLIALALVVAGGLGGIVDARAMFAIPIAALPLAIIGFLLASSRVTRHQDADDAGDRRRRIRVAIAAMLWLVHAAVLAKLFVELRKPLPMSSAQDVAFSVALGLMVISTIFFFTAAAERLQGIERWMTGDVEGSLFAGATGILIFGPLLILGLVHAMMSVLTRPTVWTVWRIDRVIIALAAIDLAWRSLRALRLSIHSLRHAGETVERETRLEEAREDQFREPIDRLKK